MSPLIVSIISLSIIFLATTLGSGLVFFFKKPYSERVNSIIIGLASGIMISVTFFGLLKPSMEEGANLYGEKLAFVPALVGFLLGALLLFILDRVVPHLHKGIDFSEEEGPTNTKVSSRMKFFLAVTLHNIPEGMAVGLACGIAFSNLTNDSMMSALSLAIGIAIQNFPEGSAVSIPLRGDGMSRTKSFLFGMGSGVVEPIFGVIAIFLASYLTSLVPYLLAFAGGAMIYVTIDDLIPEFKNSKFDHFGMWAFIIGFAIMMVLESVL